MNINYRNKYYKYKKKYLNLKNINQLPGGAAAAASQGFDDKESTEAIKYFDYRLLNLEGTCWYHSVLSLFFNSPTTREQFDKSVIKFLNDEKNVLASKIIENTYSRFEAKIRKKSNDEEENKYKYLSMDQLRPIFEIVATVSQRYLNIKLNSSNDESVILRSIHVDKICETKIIDSFREIIKSGGRGGSSIDSYIISNIISIGILNKFTNYIVRNPLTINSENYTSFFSEDSNIIGYTIDIPRHVLCIYKDKLNNYKYINNEVIKGFTCYIIFTIVQSYSNLKKYRYFANFKDLLETLIFVNGKNWIRRLFLIDHSIVLEVYSIEYTGGAGAWSKEIKYVGDAVKAIKEEKIKREQRKELEAFFESSKSDEDLIPKYDNYIEISEGNYKLNQILEKLKDKTVVKRGFIRAIGVLKLSDITIDIMDNVGK